MRRIKRYRNRCNYLRRTHKRFGCHRNRIAYSKSSFLDVCSRKCEHNEYWEALKERIAKYSLTLSGVICNVGVKAVGTNHQILTTERSGWCSGKMCKRSDCDLNRNHFSMNNRQCNEMIPIPIRSYHWSGYCTRNIWSQNLYTLMKILFAGNFSKLYTSWMSSFISPCPTNTANTKTLGMIGKWICTIMLPNRVQWFSRQKSIFLVISLVSWHHRAQRTIFYW